MSGQKPCLRKSYRHDIWDATIGQWTTEDDGTQLRMTKLHTESVAKCPSVPSRVVEVCEHIVEIHSPPAPWAE